MQKLDNILLVDDNEADNLYHGIMISKAKPEIRIKSIDNGQEALEYLTKSLSRQNADEFPLPDLIFLDINMPGMDGFELLTELREVPDPDKLKKKIKICMLTGSLNPDDKKLAIEGYGDLISDFHIKPLSGTAFTEIVNKYFSDGEDMKPGAGL